VRAAAVAGVPACLMNTEAMRDIPAGGHWGRKRRRIGKNWTLPSEGQEQYRDDQSPTHCEAFYRQNIRQSGQYPDAANATPAAVKRAAPTSSLFILQSSVRNPATEHSATIQSDENAARRLRLSYVQ